MNTNLPEDHLGIFHIDVVPNVTVNDTMTGATKQVDEIAIYQVADDIDDIVVDDLYKAYQVSRRHVLVVRPSAPSIFRSRHNNEFVQAATMNGVLSVQELDARRVGINGMERVANRQVSCFLLEFDESIQLESRFFQNPLREGELQTEFTHVQFNSAAGLVHTTTALCYKLSIVPQEERVLQNAPVRGMSNMDILRRRMQSMGVGQQQQMPHLVPQQQPFAPQQQQPQFGNPGQQQHVRPQFGNPGQQQQVPLQQFGQQQQVPQQQGQGQQQQNGMQQAPANP